MAVQPLKKLGPNHRKFADRYLTHWNKTRAAKEAGYSEKSADVQAHHLLRDPKIRAYIKQRQREMYEELAFEPEEILRGWVNAVRADRRELLVAAGGKQSGANRWTFRDPDSIPDHIAELIESIKHKPGEFGDEVEVKLVSREQARQSMAKHYDLFKDLDKAAAMGGGLAAKLKEKMNGSSDSL